MISLLNYANQAYRYGQRLNSKTASAVGGFDQVFSVGPKDIDADFRSAHQQILQAPRGNGFWLWKPYFINRMLRELPENSWLFYADSGSYFVSPVTPLIEIAASRDLSLMTFADAHPEKKYAKRDALLLLEADRPDILNSPQRLGGFSLWRNDEFSRQFSGKWLKACTDPRILTDQPNTLGLPNHPEFQDHRHDQTVFSILAKQHRLPAFRDPSQWGNDRIASYPDSTYPQVLQLTRQGGQSRWKRLKRQIKSLIRKD